MHLLEIDECLYFNKHFMMIHMMIFTCLTPAHGQLSMSRGLNFKRTGNTDRMLLKFAKIPENRNRIAIFISPLLPCCFYPPPSSIFNSKYLVEYLLGFLFFVFFSIFTRLKNLGLLHLMNFLSFLSSFFLLFNM